MADQVSLEESGGLKYAKAEFARLHRLYDGAEPDMRPIVFEYEKEILALVDKFGKSGQSGASAPFTAGAIVHVLKNLFRHEPISPIEDLPEDWVKLDYDDRVSYQHKRCAAVFKDAVGRAHYLDGVVFQGEDEHDTFTVHGAQGIDGVSSTQHIKSWPFTPKTFTIHVKRERSDTHPDRVSCSDGDYLYRIANPSELNAVWEYYARPTGPQLVASVMDSGEDVKNAGPDPIASILAGILSIDAKPKEPRP